MAITNIRELLVDFAMKEKPENKIAKVLAYYYPNINLSEKKGLFESLLTYYKISDSAEMNFNKILSEINSDDELETLKGKDFRIKSLEISNVRGIPDKDEQGIPFGIDFSEDGQINNAIILANNGTGKSSVFSALEMVFAQEIGEKQLRTSNTAKIDKSDFNKYLLRFPQYSKPNFNVYTQEGEFDLENIVFRSDKTRRLLNPSNHFISDFDIYHYGQKEYNGSVENKNSFHSLIADSLGLGEFIQLQSILKEVSNYRRSTESNNLKKLNGQKTDIQFRIKKWKEEIEFKNRELLALEEQGNSKLPESEKIYKDKISKLTEWINRPLDFNITSAIYTEAMEGFIESYLDSLSRSKNDKEITEKSFLAAGLDLIHSFEDCPFCTKSTKSLGDIQRIVELRLEILRGAQKLEEDLKGRFYNLTKTLVLFFKQAANVYKAINIERDEMFRFPDLGILINKEDKFYIALAAFLNDYDLNNLLDTLNDKQYPEESDYKQLFELVSQRLIKVNVKILIEELSNFISSRRSHLEMLIEKSSSVSIFTSIATQKVVLDEDIKRLVKQIETSEIEIPPLTEQIQKAELEDLLVMRIKKEIQDFIAPLDLEVNKLVNDAFSPIQDIVEVILKDYFKEDDVDFKIDKKEIISVIEGEEVRNHVIIAIIESVNKTTGNNEPITPDIYFNTFRYKLFCLMVSLSLALATRKKYKVNLPLVIDDIFFASDFVSKNSFAGFLQKIIKVFHKHTPELPLQFILFTHDDLIFKSAIDAIYLFSSEDLVKEKQHIAEMTLVGRFFDPNDKDDIPSEFENGKPYWNLMYQLPKTINQLF